MATNVNVRLVPTADYRKGAKPWFSGKLAFAPTVVDLGTKGFPLVGGRIDVVQVAPVTSLVYSHGKHLISLTEMPNLRGAPAPVTSHSEQGYLARSWSDEGTTYWAVSRGAQRAREFRRAVPGRYSRFLIALGGCSGNDRMSAMGHERTLERGSGMSASSPRADMLSVEHGMSAKCQKQTCWQ